MWPMTAGASLTLSEAAVGRWHSAPGTLSPPRAQPAPGAGTQSPPRALPPHGPIASTTAAQPAHNTSTSAGTRHPLSHAHSQLTAPVSPHRTQHRHPVSTTCTASSQHQRQHQPAPGAQHHHQQPVSTTCTASSQHQHRHPAPAPATCLESAHGQLIVI